MKVIVSNRSSGGVSVPAPFNLHLPKNGTSVTVTLNASQVQQAKSSKAVEKLIRRGFIAVVYEDAPVEVVKAADLVPVKPLPLGLRLEEKPDPEPILIPSVFSLASDFVDRVGFGDAPTFSDAPSVTGTSVTSTDPLAVTVTDTPQADPGENADALVDEGAAAAAEEGAVIAKPKKKRGRRKKKAATTQPEGGGTDE